MRITELALKRPAMMTMVALFFVVIGLYSYRSIGVELYPALNTPFVTVSAAYPGAGAEEIETQVVKPLEEGLSSLAGLKKLTSVSVEGRATILIEFELTADANQAAIDVQKKVDSIKGRLPEDVKDPVVIKRDMNALPVAAIAFSSSRPLYEANEMAKDLIKERLQKIPGVAEVTISGGQEREIQINIDRTKLERYGLSINQVIRRLDSENLNEPSGRLDRPEAEYMVRVLGQFRSVEEIRNLEIPMANGKSIALREIADVSDTYKELREYTRLNGQPALALMVFKQSDASLVDVGDRVKKEIDSLKKELPGDTQLIIARDFSQYIRLSVNGTRANILEGILTTSVALLFFLRDWRSMVSVLIAIPVSLISTLAGMYFAGFTFNVMSLMGMAMCIGILVDDSIVVLENIHRHLAMGKSPKQAALDGRSEIGMAAIAITLSDVVVFAPIAFMSGMVGQFFRQFGLTVVFATLMSLFVSFTLTPLLASRLMKPRGGGAKLHPLAGVSWYQAACIFAPVDRYAARFRDRYLRILEWSFRHRKQVIAAGVLFFFASAALVPLKLIGFEFAPRTDQGDITVNVELPIGTPIQKTDQALKTIESYLQTIPEIRYFQTSLGSTGGIGMGSAGSNIGRIGVSLVNKRERKRSVWDVSEQIRQWAVNFPDGRITVTESDSMASGSGYPVQIEVSGSDPKTLLTAVDDIKAIVAATAGSRDTDSNWRVGQPEIQISIDRLKAAYMGVSVKDISETLRASLNGNVSTKYRVGDKEYDVTVRINRLNKSDLDALRTLTLTNNAGLPVQLQQVARIGIGVGPTEIRRADRQRTITISAGLQGRVLDDFLKEVDSKIKAKGLPQGVSYRFTGSAQSMQDSFRELVAALALSIVLVYMVLVMLYESYMTPFIRMLSLPLGIAGALIALAVTKNSLNIFSLIGIIMMDGLVAKNGTLLIDYTHTLRERGRSLKEALIEAGQTRLRPIIMTTVTMVFGMLPSALALTEGSETRSSMAVVLIGGLLSSTLFTLIIIPVVYTLMEDWKEGLRRRWGKVKERLYSQGGASA
ncbi:acriflavin resistance protein, putative [Heliomicrobium modesticaldum Ice1]|uniref:Acriflavin resistance protein, putative n=1 Tax=Heliobacterium modesticaldum (strain ATCC 51547 / Ice1) TaxID=498761 RepID=B0TFJ8_HELMI|nr:efflux RND transporter permease subunit [Heliomicrobium modesticaldum]ABZ83097.1 acriflavin resistance protein, putative [Heliomicrobium modesticaldum Ice1]